MFNLLWRDIRTNVLNGTITVEDIYWLFYSRVWMATGIIFTLSLGVDYYGINGIQLIFLPIWLFAIGYIGLPIIGLSEAVITDRLREVVCNLRRFVLHLALFGAIFFTTRFLVPVRDYPFASMMLLTGTIIIGLVTWLWPATDPKIYRRYALAIAIIVIALGLFGAFTGQRPANGAHPMTPMHNGVEGVVSNFFYSKTLELEVTSLQPQKLCGVQTGNRKFAIPHKSYVIINGDNYDVTSFVRVNRMLPDESFVVMDDEGCVDVSFAFTSSMLGQAITPQVIQIAFR